MRRASFLTYRKLRYLKLSAALLGLILLTAWVLPDRYGFAYGGTLMGYLSGTLAAFLAGLLAWYGIRKRRPPRIEDRRHLDRRCRVETSQARMDQNADQRTRERRGVKRHLNWQHGGTLMGWLSAHCYLGGVLFVVASLHSGLHFGLNIHTLTYVLLVVLVASGVWGALAYVRYPLLISRNADPEGTRDRQAQLAEVERKLRANAADLPVELSAAVAISNDDSPLVFCSWWQIFASRASAQTDVALTRIQSMSGWMADAECQSAVREVYALLLKKQHLLAQIADASRLNARMRIWQIMHGPVSLAFVGVLVAHVSSMLVFW
ncbi:MAG: hypothetical protein K9J42_07595 [Sulfuritalea sp.]|nr:hypothetical protein [Sulfuritalea sp.]